MDPTYNINFDEAKLLCKEKRYFPWIIREAIEIEKNKYNFHRDDSYSLTNSWKCVLLGEKKKQKTVAKHK
jgi:hypothetical protein